MDRLDDLVGALAAWALPTLAALGVLAVPWLMGWLAAALS